MEGIEYIFEKTSESKRKPWKRKKGIFLTPKEWERKEAEYEREVTESRSKEGLRVFNRRVFGIRSLFSWRTIKSVDELEKILVEINVTDSVEEGRKIIPEMCDIKFYYRDNFFESNPRGPCPYTLISKVEDSDGQKAYEITKSW